MVAHKPSYESGVIREIDHWIATQPSALTRVVSQASRPLAASRWLADPKPVVKAAGVADLANLRSQSLKLSDDLSRRAGRMAQSIAVVGGLVTGIGGLPLAALDVAALMLILLHGIHRTGQCYGYALDEPHDKAYILAILTLAGTQSVRARHELHAIIGDSHGWLLARSIEGIAMEGLTQQFLRIVGMEAIPGLGAMAGSLANLAFVRQVLTDCRRLFQQRWLRQNGFLRR